MGEHFQLQPKMRAGSVPSFAPVRRGRLQRRARAASLRSAAWGAMRTERGAPVNLSAIPDCSTVVRTAIIPELGV